VLKRSHFRIAHRVLIASAVLLLALTPRSVHAQIVAGRITALNGSATITRGARGFPAAYSAPVDVADQLETSPTGRLTVTLTDNSQLELTESSTLLISEDLLNPNGTRARTSLTLMGGLVRSLVRVAAGTAPNYEVHTPNAVASARGTTYDTYYTNNTPRPGFPSCKEFTDVLDYDGVVEVRSLTNPTSPAVELHSGQKTTVPCGLALLPASALAAISTGSAAAGGLSTAAIAAASAGSFAAVTGGVVGGIAGAGGFSSSSSSPAPVSKKPLTPSM
jgi:ferric-dicitrate binding protein FerR (iron transport regulator)